MSRTLGIVIGVVVVAVGLLLSSALYTVDMTQQAVVLQFGQPVETVRQAGLHVKVPFVQNVQYYDKRILELDPPVEEIILADQKRLEVNTFARYRIVNPLMFFQTVGNLSGAEERLSNIINSSTREVLGNETLLSLLSEQRNEIMGRIRSSVNESAEQWGLRITDVRIRRADLPKQTSESIYDRMRSEREREAREFRAEGFEVAQRVRSDADRQRTVIIAEAQKESQIARGQGDSKAIDIYAEAFGKDPEFFAFYRSMEAYRNSLSGSDTTMVLSPDGAFFRFFGDVSGEGRVSGRSAAPASAQAAAPAVAPGAASPASTTDAAPAADASPVREAQEASPAATPTTGGTTQ